MAVRRMVPMIAFPTLVALVMSTAAANNFTYPFNANPGVGWTVMNFDTSGVVTSATSSTMWEWTGGNSANEGGWHTRQATDVPVAATALLSPYFRVDDTGQDEVRMTLTHRFNFPYVTMETGSIPAALGQVQVSINGSDWRDGGIPTADFSGNSNHHVPEYVFPAEPTPPLVWDTMLPTGTASSSVAAFVDTSEGFATKDHHDTTVTLAFPPYTFGPGDFIQFRYVMQLQVPGSGTEPTPDWPINWEINSAQIAGVDLVVVPEPGGVVLAALGAALGAVGLRRRSPPRS